MSVTMKKASVVVATRQEGSGAAAKLTVTKPENKILAKIAQSTGSESPRDGDRKMSKLFSRRLTMGKKDDASETSQEEGGGAKRGSLMPSSSTRTSVSAGSGSRLSIVGLMASRRFAKRLMGRALEKRESTLGDGPPPVLYEPTYRLDPKKKFEPSPVLSIVKDVIDNRLKDMKYNPRITPNMNRILSEEVKDRVKKLNFDRYKIIVLVMIGEKKGQGIMVSSRCSWDDKVDNYVTHTFQNKNIFCTCNVYGAYKE
ncbi:tctex1 domain-containing protein 4-like [Aplysia californica]|uniref:Tctex1 domain-containing protein 4-like n=1 Tax=Aplysia californica TaxID=6500 RepID=A0ABM0K2B4_APLCA|nr:tctex1 domain-containing protein 4-like [Aplysia californica]